jgi:DNA-binding MarR family transcriptional regulator
MTILKNNLEDQLIKNFYNFYSLIDTILKVKTKDSLSLKESYLLLVVDKLLPKKENTVSNIANELKITIPAASLSISTLVKKNYLNRVHDENDRRVYLITITDKSRIVLDAQENFRRRVLEDIISQLNPIERASLIAMLNRLDGFVAKDLERIRKDYTPLINK